LPGLGTVPETKHGFSAEQIPVFAYVGSSNNLKDLKVQHMPGLVYTLFCNLLSADCSVLTYVSLTTPHLRDWMRQRQAFVKPLSRERGTF